MGRCPSSPSVAMLVSSQRLIEERDSLREANEELRCAQVQQKFLNQAGEDLDTSVVFVLGEISVICIRLGCRSVCLSVDIIKLQCEQIVRLLGKKELQLFE